MCPYFGGQIRSYRTIQTDSDPPGARVTVDEVIGSTPQAIQVPARSSYTVSISKPGFERVSQKLNSEIIIWPIIADILLGVWPLIIDAATGDWYTPVPNTIFTRLNPEKTGPGSQTK